MCVFKSFAVPRGMWDLNFPGIEPATCNHWTTREVIRLQFRCLHLFSSVPIIYQSWFWISGEPVWPTSCQGHDWLFWGWKEGLRESLFLFFKHPQDFRLLQLAEPAGNCLYFGWLLWWASSFIELSGYLWGLYLLLLLLCLTKVRWKGWHLLQKCHSSPVSGWSSPHSFDSVCWDSLQTF